MDVYVGTKDIALTKKFKATTNASNDRFGWNRRSFGIDRNHSGLDLILEGELLQRHIGEKIRNKGSGEDRRGDI